MCHGTNLSRRGERKSVRVGGAGSCSGLGPGAGLCGTVMVRVVVTGMAMMVASGGKSRGSDQHNEQGSEHKLFHMA